MFARSLQIDRITQEEESHPVPLAWLDSFAMRNFTNDAIFDDTLPLAEGRMEAGYRVPLPALAAAMEAWFRRKSWLGAGERLLITEQPLRLRASIDDEPPSKP